MFTIENASLLVPRTLANSEIPREISFAPAAENAVNGSTLPLGYLFNYREGFLFVLFPLLIYNYATAQLRKEAPRFFSGCAAGLTSLQQIIGHLSPNS